MSVKATLRPLRQAARDAAGWGRGLAGYLAGAPHRRSPLVSYGHARVPAPNEPAIGGIVKLQELARVYPPAGARFNVLYLVSSRLPDGAVAQAVWARRKGARVVVNQNGVAYPAWCGDGWQRVNAPMTRLLALADHVFYQSEFCRVSADRFAGAARGPWEILHNAVDTGRFSPAPRAGSPVVMLLGGSQEAWYRVDAALQTLAAVVARGRDARLVVTGRLRWGADVDEPRRQAGRRAAELGIADRVTWTGPYTQNDAPAIYRGADMLLHTKYNDPCPTVVLEAMASGLPVVYSRSGGVPELVGPDAGIGVDAPLDWDRDHPPAPPALADAVLRVLDARSRFADAARQRAVDRFDVAPWIARHRAVFEAA